MTEERICEACGNERVLPYTVPECCGRPHPGDGSCCGNPIPGIAFAQCPECADWGKPVEGNP